MKIKVEEGKFTDQESKKEIKYKKFLAECIIDDLSYDIPIKLNSQFEKQMVNDHIETAELIIEPNEFVNKNGEIVHSHNAYVTIEVGSSVQKIAIKLEKADMFICQLAEKLA